jgi:hypothetical protein
MNKMIFVLLESGQAEPIAVLSEACKPYMLPADAKQHTRYEKGPHAHREVVCRWYSESFGTLFSLVAYVLQSNGN